VATLRDLIRSAEHALAEGPHAERARPDAELLLLHVLGKTRQDPNRAWLIANAKLPALPDVNEEFNALIERRRRGEPIQYITGETEFYGMPFRVTPDVLIPRPETEHVVEKAFQLIPVFHPESEKLFEARRSRTGKARRLRRENVGGQQDIGWPPRVLDIGAGSGAICISIAHDWPEAEITATDTSRAALDVALGNAQRLGFADEIRFLQGDLLEPVAGERFELIVSNPPYVAEAGRDALSVEVRDYEPSEALFAGADGLAVYRRLIPEAHTALVPGGYLLLEIGAGQFEAVRNLLSSATFSAIEFVPDLQGIPRVACAQRP